jgi:hypothetical protein
VKEREEGGNAVGRGVASVGFNNDSAKPDAGREVAKGALGSQSAGSGMSRRSIGLGDRSGVELAKAI